MTKTELEGLKALKYEIKSIQDELNNLPMVTDSVTGSMTEHPYISHKINIQGTDISAGEKIKKRLEGKCGILQDQIRVMEDWLESVEDSEMRVILRLRYRNGLSWGEIAAQMGYKYTVDSVKKKHYRFLNKI